MAMGQTPPRGVVVAGTHSGCGKTSVTLGLLAAWVRQGIKVQSFKAGPDFIDPGLHAAVTGRACQNLDGWLLGRERCRELFHRHCHGADLVLVEGVMGLFDGASGRGEQGSTAELAKWLDLPVLLVLDARSMARSVAPLVQGFARFDPELRLAGVLCNRVGSARHRELLEEALLSACPDLPLVGFLRREPDVTLPERHLGLVTAQEGVLTPKRLTALADWVSAGVELGALQQRLPQVQGADPAPTPRAAHRVRLGVARDQAFCFCYPENLRILEACGAEPVFFSPLQDQDLPPDLGGLYFPGGYPELYAAQLSANAGLRRAVQAFARSGRPVYGECGGFMYLMEALHTAEGVFPMAGVLPLQCAMAPRLAALGYRELITREPGLFGPAWTMLRGHEFHYSHLLEPAAQLGGGYKVLDARGRDCGPEGFRQGSVLGSYIHVHFGSNPDAAAAFVAACAGQPFSGANHA